jgi:serine/threonine-protein kinase HipA
MKLDVQVLGKKVAQLYRDRDEYVLEYERDAPAENFISLTMPVREAPWRWPRDLHPFFRQNLPEGYVLSVIREEFGPLLDGTDLSLLAVVGGMGIGRVTVTPEGVPPGMELEPLQLEELLSGDDTIEHFANLVRRYARAAISGAVPKLLAPNSTTQTMPLGKPSLRASRHIIKGSDDATPYLGFNEFHTLRVLERLDVVPVVRSRMSDNGRLLIVERFDVDADGTPVLGLEDACGLLGLPPHEKYATSTEKVINATRAYLPSQASREQLQHLGWQLLTNYVVRNADCHAKNIALYYSSLTDVTYTPVFDVVTTQAYPRYAASPPGLSLAGRKTWMPGKSLETFFNARLGIAPRQFTQMLEQLCESAIEVGQEVIEDARNETRWQNTANQMVHAWNEGMKSLRTAKTDSGFRGLDAHIQAAGLPAPAAPENTRSTVGRSELLAPRLKR